MSWHLFFEESQPKDIFKNCTKKTNNKSRYQISPEKAKSQNQTEIRIFKSPFFQQQDETTIKQNEKEISAFISESSLKISDFTSKKQSKSIIVDRYNSSIKQLEGSLKKEKQQRVALEKMLKQQCTQIQNMAKQIGEIKQDVFLIKDLSHLQNSQIKNFVEKFEKRYDKSLIKKFQGFKKKQEKNFLNLTIKPKIYKDQERKSPKKFIFVQQN